ncbi:MAG: VWA domain-containing protein [Taibaiella sp.]|nr:VWA domain-containing protein [Taibaiella sp.]
MTKTLIQSLLLLAILISGCQKGEKSSSTTGTTSTTGSTSSTSGGSGNPGGQHQPGVITAGEWNDLDNWAFWLTINARTKFITLPPYWGFYNNNRVSVSVKNADGSPAISVPVELKRGTNTIFTAQTDNKGTAELWVDIFQNNTNVAASQLSLVANNATTINGIKLYADGVNELTIPSSTYENEIEISFVVDATGSMGDELEYLKTELLDVIEKVKANNPNSNVSTGSVFYRDKGDTYVTRVSPFSSDINTTLKFIKDQSAGGGGDFPEAVNTALDKAVNELQWMGKAKTKLLFLVLDAPPHDDANSKGEMQQVTMKAASQGIKMIPIVASGINKETEGLMRYLAITTNGTYVFITDDSGVGNDHLEATVGQYSVEKLNDLMVRLINKYAQ